MRGEERLKFRMLLLVVGVVDQRRPVGEFACDLRILASEIAPGVEFLHVDIASVGGFGLDRGIPIDHNAQRLSFLRHRWSSENEGKRDRNKQS